MRLTFQNLVFDVVVNTQYKDGNGLSLSAVRTFGRQLFRALRHIHGAGVVHADIKPDNIVLNRKLNVAKVSIHALW